MPQPMFFPVSVGKLALLSVCTFGLYQTYWFYWNWRLVKHREARRLSPPWRSVLGVLYALPIFRRIARQSGSRRHVALALVAFLPWAGLSLATYGPIPWAALSLASVLPLLPMQAAANAINARVAPGHDRNAGLHGWNVVAIVLGGALAALNLLGLLLYAMQR